MKTMLLNGEAVTVEKYITPDLVQVLLANGDRVAVPTADLTIDPAYVTRLADQVWNEIMDDIAEGVVPQNVPTFSALHDHVDANGYLLHLYDDIADPDERDAVWNAVTDAVDTRLAARLAAMPIITDGPIPDGVTVVVGENGTAYHLDDGLWNVRSRSRFVLALDAEEMRAAYPLRVVSTTDQELRDVAAASIGLSADIFANYSAHVMRADVVIDSITVFHAGGRVLAVETPGGFFVWHPGHKVTYPVPTVAVIRKEES